MEYDKLVRDRIPEIIDASGKKYVIEKCNSPHEINQRLIEKLLASPFVPKIVKPSKPFFIKDWQ
mgnify:CR=1 FL=1